MTPEEQENLNYLLLQLKQQRDSYYEMQKDYNTTRDQLVLLFNKHKIKQTLLNDVLYKIDTHTIYKYPASCKKHKNTIKKQSKEYIKMLNNDNMSIYTKMLNSSKK